VLQTMAAAAQCRSANPNSTVAIRLSQSPSGLRAAVAAESLAPSAVGSNLAEEPVPAVKLYFSEQVSPVSGSMDLANSAYLIHIGNSELFAYCHQIMQLFQSGRWVVLSARYLPTTATVVTGELTMSMNANPNDAPFTTEQQALNNAQRTSGDVWDPQVLNLLSKTNRALPIKLIEDITGTNALGNLGGFFADLGTLADGILNIVTKGIASLAMDEYGNPTARPEVDPIELGQLMIDYGVELFEPKFTVSADEGFSYMTFSGGLYPSTSTISVWGEADTNEQVQSVSWQPQYGTTNPLKIRTTTTTNIAAAPPTVTPVAGKLPFPLPHTLPTDAKQCAADIDAWNKYCGHKPDSKHPVAPLTTFHSILNYAFAESGTYDIVTQTIVSNDADGHYWTSTYPTSPSLNSMATGSNGTILTGSWKYDSGHTAFIGAERTTGDEYKSFTSSAQFIVPGNNYDENSSLTLKTTWTVPSVGANYVQSFTRLAKLNAITTAPDFNIDVPLGSCVAPKNARFFAVRGAVLSEVNTQQASVVTDVMSQLASKSVNPVPSIDSLK